jgi:hypothetical protein
MKTRQDKYLGRTFGRWTVSRVTVIKTAKSKHKRYYLTRKTHDGAIKTVALRDNELTALSRGTKTMQSLLKGKQFQRSRFPSREFRNSVWYTFKTNGSLE